MSNTGSNSRLHRARAAESHVERIKKSSKYRIRRQNFEASKRENPCKDHETRQILTAALKADKVRVRELFRFAKWPDYVLLGIGFIFILLTVIIGLFIIYNLRIGRMKEKAVPDWLLIPLAMAVFSAFAFSTCFHISSNFQIYRMRMAYMKSLVRQNKCWFESTYADRDLPLRVIHETGDIGAVLGEGISFLILSFLVVVIGLGVSTWIHWQYTCSAFIFVPLQAFVAYYKYKVEDILRRKEFKVYEPANAVARDSLMKIKTIKLCHGTDKALAAYKAALYSPLQLKGKLFLAAALSGLFWLLAGSAFIGFGRVLRLYLPNKMDCDKHWNETYCDSYILNRTEYEYGQLRAILATLIFVSIYMAIAPVWIQRVKKAQSFAAEIFLGINWVPRIDNLSVEGRARGNTLGQLSMQKVYFNYPLREKARVLHNINVKIYPGQMVAIFGPPGCGKSTLLNLFLRLYDPCRGQVLIDNNDVSEVNIQWLRSQIGIVPQYPQMLNATIEENICGPKTINTENEDELLKVCAQAGIFQDILDLPQGFQTVVGIKSDVELTMSQMKRICLARVYMQRAPILLLDDLFKDMTEEEAHEVSVRLEKMRGKATVIFTCTQINTLIKDCDSIFVMKHGRIVQTGNHEVLATDGGQDAYMKLLTDTLEDSSSYSIRPHYDSQLLYYKYAQSITRLHELHDEEKQIDYKYILHNHHAIKSVLLRNDVSYHNRTVQPRYIGGFYRFIVYDYQEDSNYTRVLLRSRVLRDRDLRDKIVTHLGRPISSISKHKSVGSLVPGENVKNGSKSSLLSAVSSQLKTTGKSLPGKIINKDKTSCALSRLCDRVFRRNKKGDPEEGDGIIIFDQLEAQALPKSKEKGRRYSGDKLRHYFGTTVNTLVDSESISSEASFLFWAEYSHRLQNAMDEDPGDISKLEVLRLSKYLWVYIAFGVVTACSLGIGVLVFPAIRAEDVQVSFDKIKPTKPFLVQRNELKVNYVTIVLSLAVALASFIQELVLGYGACAANNKMRLVMFKQILEQELEWFDSPSHDIGILCDNLAADIPAITSAFVGFVTLNSQTICMVVVMFAFDLPILSSIEVVYVIGISIFLFVSGYLEGRAQREFKKKPTRCLQQLVTILYDMVTCYEQIISVGWSQYFVDRFQKALAACRGCSFYFQMAWRSLVFAVADGNGLIAVTIWSVTDNELTPSVHHFYFLAFLIAMVPSGYAAASIPPWYDVARSAAMIIQTKKLCEKKMELDKRKLTIAVDPSAPPPSIRLENVNFAFEMSSDVTLDDFSFEFPGGTYVGIVGWLQSGKYALVGLLMRLYVPLKGEIFLGQVNYKDIDEQSFRRSIAVVEKDADFFPELSLAENIAYGDNSRSVPFEDVVAASELALIHSIIEDMPHKYDTKVKDLPFNPDMFAFKQRMSIARVAVSSAKVIIVEEATVSINDENTDLLLQALANLMEGRTCIVSSQRVEPIRRADIILVLNYGKLVEVGTDETLLSTRGIYYELHMRQRLYEHTMSLAKLADSRSKTDLPPSAQSSVVGSNTPR